MTSETTSADARHNGERGDRPELAEELAIQKGEVLRLRDLLIARDAELGAARGQIAEMEAGAGRLLNLAARVHALVPSFVWSARSALRGRHGSGS
jgi:hypothetical protein